MDYFWQLNVTYLMNILLCFLICFVHLNESASYDDLKVACGIKYKPVQDVNLNNVPDECTSVILNCKDFPDEHVFNNIMKSPRKVPTYLIVDDFPYDSWLTSFKTDIQDTVEKYKDIIIHYDLDGLFFDNLYPDQTLNVKVETNSFTTKILKAFLKDLKTAEYSTKDNVFLGIVIPSNANTILNGFSYYYLDPYIDAYLLYNKTNYFEKCTEREGPLSPTYKIEEIAEALYSYKLFYMNKDKVILESQLYVKDAINNYDLSYGETCHLCPGTKVCRSSLKSIYQKARLMHDIKLGGTYIRYCNQDDLRGQCYCGDNTPFPGVKAIAAAIGGDDVDFVECSSYGVPGVYRPKGKCGYPQNAHTVLEPDDDDIDTKPVPEPHTLPEYIAQILND